MIVVINGQTPLLNMLVSITKQVYAMSQVKEQCKICPKSELWGQTSFCWMLFLSIDAYARDAGRAECNQTKMTRKLSLDEEAQEV